MNRCEAAGTVSLPPCFKGWKLLFFLSTVRLHHSPAPQLQLQLTLKHGGPRAAEATRRVRGP
jgi:hypothetical protein